MDDRIVIVRTYANEFEADLARAILEAHEIPAMVLRDDAGGMYPSLTFIHGVRLAVRGEDAADARALLDAPTPLPDDEDIPDGEGNDATDDTVDDSLYYDDDARYVDQTDGDEEDDADWGPSESDDEPEPWEHGDDWNHPRGC